MKRFIAIFLVLMGMFTVTSCNPLRLGKTIPGDAIEEDIKEAERIVFTNNKEKSLKFTVSDTKVISQLVSIIGEATSVEGEPGVSPDYTILINLPRGVKRQFYYWMGAVENEKEINFMDENGSYYRIPATLDSFIVNSTKMGLRPENFAELYSLALSKCISTLEKNAKGNTVVGVDITSDRRLRKYTMSYEDEKIFGGISADGYDIEEYVEGGKYTYVVSYVTNIYNTDKAKITVEVMKTEDTTKKTLTVNAMLSEEKVWEVVVEG